MDVEEFGIGWLIGSLMLVKLETLFIVGILAIGYYAPRLSVPCDLLAIVAALIFVVGHIKTSFTVWSSLEHEAREAKSRVRQAPKTLRDALRYGANPLNSLVFRGFLLRFARELKYIQHVANFNFFRP